MYKRACVLLSCKEGRTNVVARTHLTHCVQVHDQPIFLVLKVDAVVAQTHETALARHLPWLANPTEKVLGRDPSRLARVN